MHNEYTAVIENDGQWYIGYCLEVPGANGQGRSLEECKKNLADAIALIIEDRRADALRGVPDDAIKEVITIS
ncbi:MAG: type II toxin-antitoxin system HicB family antitoxin [Nitrospirae bacterium]|nr:type II toxin-antitoxin system HicB family antitoxin [Nitrospirota bacterium]